MRRWAIHFTPLLASVLLAAAAPRGAAGTLEGNGVRESEIRDVAAFDSIEVDGAMEVEIRCQRERRVEVTADANLLPHVVTRVEDGRLLLSVDTSFSTEIGIEVSVSSPDVTAISASGAVDIEIAEIDNARLAVSMEGAGRLEASGRTDALDVTISGAGRLRAGDLRAESARIRVDGAANAVIHATSKLDARLDGVSSVTVRGHPQQVEQETSFISRLVLE